VLQVLFQLSVIVDLPVHRQNQFAVGGTQRLRSAFRIDDSKTLVNDDGAFIQIDTAPIRATMTLTLGPLKSLSTQSDQVITRLQTENA
jgi:hypothetical protein